MLAQCPGNLRMHRKEVMKKAVFVIFISVIKMRKEEEVVVGRGNRNMTNFHFNSPAFAS